MTVAGPMLPRAYAPYMKGAETFTVATVVATELMHLVSGAAVVFALAPAASSVEANSPADRWLIARAVAR